MKFSVQELRPEVLSFALLMEARLREKDADKGQTWKTKATPDLVVPARMKLMQLELSEQRPVTGAKHAVDLANYCMMIADVGGAL